MGQPIIHWQKRVLWLITEEVIRSQVSIEYISISQHCTPIYRAVTYIYYMLTKYLLYQAKVMNKGSLIQGSLLLEIQYFIISKIISFVRNVIILIKYFQGKNSHYPINSQITFNFKTMKTKNYHNWIYQILIEWSDINILFYYFPDFKIRWIIYLNQPRLTPYS